MSADIPHLDFAKLALEFRNIYRRLPTIAGVRAVAFFKGSFKRQGWVNEGKLDNWRKRKTKEKGGRRSLLIKTGRLRRSIRVLVKTTELVGVGTNVPYAQIHNEGGTITADATVKQHTRRVRISGGYGKLGDEKKRKKIMKITGAEHQVKMHKRKMNTTIPQRQFIGQSPDVIKSIEREVFRQIINAMKKI